ncbi:hypothetical protein [Caminibacter pacificus]
MNNIPTKTECKEHNCKIDKKNIITIYNPEKKYNIKMCDCIIKCKNNKYIIIEILCGTLTLKEFKDKLGQIKNCEKILTKNNLKASQYLIYKKKEKKDAQILNKLILKEKKLQLKIFKNQAIKICN